MKHSSNIYSEAANNSFCLGGGTSISIGHEAIQTGSSS